MISEQGFTEVHKGTNVELKVEGEVSVEINYRCWFSATKALYPMNVWTSVVKGKNLQQIIERQKKEYEKQYLKVEVVNVFVDMEAVSKFCN